MHALQKSIAPEMELHGECVLNIAGCELIRHTGSSGIDGVFPGSHVIHQSQFLAREHASVFRQQFF